MRPGVSKLSKEKPLFIVIIEGFNHEKGTVTDIQVKGSMRLGDILSVMLNLAEHLKYLIEKGDQYDREGR